MVDQILVSDSEEDHSPDQFPSDSSLLENLSSSTPENPDSVSSLLKPSHFDPSTGTADGGSEPVEEETTEVAPETVSSSTPHAFNDFIFISHHPKPPSVVIQCEYYSLLGNLPEEGQGCLHGP